MDKPPLSYIVALLACVVALGAKLILDPWLGRDTPFLLFLGAVTLAAWNGGLGPGLLATTFSTFLTLSYFILPVGAFPTEGYSWLHAVAFFVEGVLISLLASARRMAREDVVVRARQQEALAELSQEILRGLPSFGSLCDRASTIVVRTLNCDMSLMMTLDEGGNLTVCGNCGWPQELLSCAPFVPDDGTQAGYTVRTREAVVVPDVREERRFGIHEHVIEAGTRSTATVLIGNPDNPSGVLAAYSKYPRHFGPEDVDFLQGVANVLAVALERVRSDAAREESEDKLRTSELRYRTFFEQSTEAIWRFELEQPISTSLPEDELLDQAYQYGYLAECNNAFARMYGFQSRDELLGARLADLLIREEPKNQEYLRTFVRSGFRLSDAESVEVDRFGNEVIFSNTLLGIIENGNLVRAWGTQRDITEEKQAATKLRASEERFRSLFESAPLGTTIIRDGHILYANYAEARLMGVERPADLVGRSVWDFIAAEEHERLARNFDLREADISNPPLIVEATAVRQDGGRFQFRSALATIELPDGPALLAFTMDVTEQKMAEAKVRASEERFRALFDAAPIPIAITRVGRILYVNDAAVRMLGFDTAAELVGRDTMDFLVPEQRERMADRLERRASGLPEEASYEVVGFKRDGSRFPVRIEVGQLALPDAPASLVFAFDLTTQKRIEAERLTALERERRAAARALRLQEVTSALAGAATVDEVAQIVVESGVPATGASAGSLAMPNESGLHIIRAVGYPAGITERYDTLDIAANYPLTQAYRQRRAVWYSDAPQEITEPVDMIEVLRQTGTSSIASLPLISNDRILGIFSLSFKEPQEFDEDTRAFILTLAAQCAQGLERVRALEDARAAARRQQESLALLDTLLDSAPVGFAFFDNGGRFVMLNDALARMNGVPAQEHIARRLHQVLPDMDPKLEEMLKTVLETAQPSGETELLGITPASAGETRHWLASVYPVRTEDGSLLGAGAVIVEITERVRAERERLDLVEQLEIERARFEAILRQMPSAVIIGEAPSGNLVLGNEQVQKLLRRPFFEANNIQEYNEYNGFHLDGRPVDPEEWPLSRAIRQGEVVTGEEIAIARGDGTLGVIRLNAAPIRDRDGHITAGVVIFDDITERSRADAAQRFLAESGSALVASLEERDVLSKLAGLCVPRVADWCIVAVPDEDGLVQEAFIAHADADKFPVAQRFKRQWSFDPRVPWDITGAMRSRRALLYPDLTSEFMPDNGASPEFEEIVETIGARSSIVAPLVARGRVAGVMIWITAESSRVYDDADLALAEELARRAALTADNTRLFRESRVARDDAQTALSEARQARDEAENANRAKDEFLAVVSHELRTPLTPIMGWIELLRGANVPEETRQQAYEVIERNARAQAQLVNDVLDVSRITTGKLRLDFKPLPLMPVVEKAIDSLRASALAKSLTLTTDLDEVGDAKVDATRIAQVVWNLLQNAIKFTPEGGEITVKLRREGNTALLSVSDNGVGIAESFLPHVFDRFRQADSSATRPAGGLGLGLAIVRHIVEMHGGEVEANSHGENEGATFTVKIPVEAQPISTAEDETANGRSLQALPPGLHLLVVDDDVDTRTMIVHLLSMQGAEVRQADSGQRALHIVQEEDWLPDVIVSDVGMPGMDGYELRRRFREILPNVPAVALTAYAAPSDQRRALEAGFERYLSKPVDPANVVSAVTDLAPRRRVEKK